MNDQWTILAAAGVLAVTSGMSRVVAAVINEAPAHDRQLNETSNGPATAGTETLIRVGYDAGGNDRMFSILRWTLSTVPGGELATGDGLITLNVHSDGGLAGQTIEAYAIVPANTGWNEATPGDYASWDYRNTPDSVTPGTPWVGGEGLGNMTPGLGYAAAPFDTFAFNGESVITLTVPQSLINDWLSNPSNNAGIVLRQATTTTTSGFVRLHSEEEATGELVPRLSFVSAIPEPATLLLLSAGGLLLVTRRRAAGASL